MATIKVFGDSNAFDASALSDHRVIINERLGVSSDIEHALDEADAFLILPHADPLTSLSLLVAKQYNRAFANKPVVILQPSGEQSPYINMTRSMHARGVVPQEEASLYSVASTMEEAEQVLKSAPLTKMPSATTQAGQITAHTHPDRAPHKQQPDFSVCVIGSYSTKDPAHIEMAGQLGEMLHRNHWGLIYGGSDKGMLKAFAEAASGPDRSGYVKAVIPELYLWNGIEAEFHDFIDDIDVTSDIYVRMNHMAKQSDVFVAAPGGFGTAQEIAAFLQIKRSDPTQSHKPLILMNGDGFWDDMIHILENAGYKEGADFIAAQSLEQAEQLVRQQSELRI